MVDVGMSDKDLLKGQSEFVETAMDAADLVTGIDDDGFVSIFVADQCTVAGQGANGKGLANHDPIVSTTRGGARRSLFARRRFWGLSVVRFTIKALADVRILEERAGANLSPYEKKVKKQLTRFAFYSL
jgi:hypothetical protein